MENPRESSSSSTLLSFPPPAPLAQPGPQVTSSASSSASAPLRKDRLYVGNLHSSVDEYTLLQLFSKYGKISKLDFLFHKSGPSKGKPRGYAFVEFSAKEDAAKALVGLHDKLVRGRKIVVTFAQQTSIPQDSSSYKAGGGMRRGGMDTSRPTALSLIKTHNRPSSTTDKIAALEAKLNQMQREERRKQESQAGMASSSALGVPLGAGLPPKPPPQNRSSVSSPRDQE